MSKYEPLSQFLGRLDAQHWRPTFHELERLLEFELPASARRRAAWWANEAKGANSQAKAWMDAGWTVEKADIAKGVVSFVKLSDGSTAARPAQPAESPPGRVAGLVDEVAARTQGAGAAARQWAGEGADRAAQIVRARPATVVGVGAGVAFAAGVVLGLLLIQRRSSTREQAVELAEDHADDLFHMLKSRLGRLNLPDRAEAVSMAQSRAEDALSALKEGLKGLHIPHPAAEIAKTRAEEALHALREGLKDLREVARERFGR